MITKSEGQITIDLLQIAYPFFVVFLVLRLSGLSPFVAWSWWLVFSPLWISIIVWLVVFCAIIASLYYRETR